MSSYSSLADARQSDGNDQHVLDYWRAIRRARQGPEIPLVTFEQPELIADELQQMENDP